MAVEARLGLAFALGLAVCWLVTPLAIRVAVNTDFHDRPVGYKDHAAATPYLGGVAVLAGFLAAAIPLGGGVGHLFPIAGGAALLWVVGTVDDRIAVTPIKRVLIEVAAGVWLWAAGLGWSLPVGEAINLALTVVWIIALVNAFNLLDNIDGATATTAAVAAAGIGTLAALRGDALLGGLAFALSGACAGFLPRNLAGPAKIFLGDGGSMPIGFVIAAAAMALPLPSHVGSAAILAGVLLVGLPIIDTSLVIISRTRRRISVLTGGRDHLTHRLLARLPSARAVALVLATTQAVWSTIAIVAFQLGADALIESSVAYLVFAAGTIALLEQSWHQGTATNSKHSDQPSRAPARPNP